MTSKATCTVGLQNGEQYEADEVADGDNCSADELRALFSKSCTLVASKRIFADKKYILHLDATRETDPSIVAASHASVDILRLCQSQIAKVTELDLAPEEKCIETKFAPTDNNVVYIACDKANIKLFDLRTPREPVREFVDTTVSSSGEMKTFLSFDVSPDDKLLAAGTELFDGDAFILFWDVRGGSLLGAYWESHTDDIMQVKFHAEDRNRLLSASADGLVNMYNLKAESEDDAFTECLNAETSIERIAWCGEDVFCALHTHNVQMWSLDDATPYGDFGRAVLSESIKRITDNYNYVAGCVADGKQSVLLIGSNFKDGECLRALAVTGNRLRPLFDCRENTQRVRGVRFDPQTRFLFTGGEKGIVDVWKLGNLS